MRSVLLKVVVFMLICGLAEASYNSSPDSSGAGRAPQRKKGTSVNTNKQSSPYQQHLNQSKQSSQDTEGSDYTPQARYTADSQPEPASATPQAQVLSSEGRAAQKARRLRAPVAPPTRQQAEIDYVFIYNIRESFKENEGLSNSLGHVLGRMKKSYSHEATYSRLGEMERNFLSSLADAITDVKASERLREIADRIR